MFNFPIGEQPDGSIIDIYGNVISYDERIKIIETVESLPVSLFKDDIYNTVKNNVITIIQGETGSGKSTQVPKILHKQGKVITTQPRVISAISLSDRVSREIIADSGDINYSVGIKVGYRTGQQVSSKHTSDISFHTDGLELMRQSISGTYPDILILDEIHNFSIPTEIIASNIRNHLLKTKLKTKLVLMSATLDPLLLQDYFSIISKDIPVIKIPGRTYPVEKYFNSGENYIQTVSTLYTKGKNVLLFMPGKKEIMTAIDMLKKKLGNEAFIYPLHSELPIKDQVKLLKKESDKPVIIVSTNIAEESITIDYIDAVVDIGKEKTIFVNEYGIDELRAIDISKANSMQRAGRAGRTHPGIYIRTNSTPYNELREYPIAPIEKEMLDRYILISLVDGIDIRKQFEELFIHQPSLELLNLSYARLKTLGAINKSGEITEIGINLLKFPLSVYNSMILLESIEKGCSEEIIYMVAIMEKKGFLSKSGEWKKIKMSLKREGDLFCYLDLFKLITSTTLSEGKLKLFKELGVDINEINLFKELEGKKMFFEVVSLDKIGIKTKKVFEIYNLIQVLKERFDRLGYKIQKASNIHDIKSCLVSGNLHNIFIYNEKTGKFRSYNNGIDLEFKPGDISLVELVNGGLYIGTPFIIGGTTTKQDFNLLTNITRIEEGLVKDYYDRVIDEDFWEIFGHKNPGFKNKKITEEQIQDFNIDNIKFDLYKEISLLKDKTKAKQYLSKNWLPYFLVNYNKIIVKFLKTSGLDKSIFLELLKKITVFHAHRINTENLEKTIHSFEFDTEIFQEFIDSEDIIIKSFLSGKITSIDDLYQTSIKAKKVQNIDRIQIIDASENTIKETKELIEYKKMYFKLLNSIKYCELIEKEEEIKLNFLNNFFSNIEFRQDYNEIIISFLNILKKYQTRQEIIQLKNEIRSLNRKKDYVNKIKKNNKDILDFIENLSKILNKEKFYLENFDISKFLEEQKYIKKFKSSLKLLTPNDSRKFNRGSRIIKQIITELKVKIFKNNLYIEELEKDINLFSYPLVRDLYLSIEKFLGNIFIQDDYFNLMIKTKIKEIILQLFTSYLDGNKNIDGTFIKFLSSKDLSRLKESNEIFVLLKNLKDLEEELINYKDNVIINIRESMDLEYIKQTIEKLSILKEKKQALVHSLKEKLGDFKIQN